MRFAILTVVFVVLLVVTTVVYFKGLERPEERLQQEFLAKCVSGFEDTKQYVLTELGSQFVHYTMNEIVPRIAPASSHGVAPPA